MTEHFLAATGDDRAGDGSLNRPWRTLARAALEGGQINVQPGQYPASLAKCTKQTTFTALGPVVISPTPIKGGWTELVPMSGEIRLTSASSIWSIPYKSAQNIGAAAWAYSIGTAELITHRIPTFAHSVPLFDTVEHWVQTVLGPNNKQTRWGCYSDGTMLYLIPPFDGTWTDPNEVTIFADQGLGGILVDGPDVTIDGLTFVAMPAAITAWGHAQRMHVTNVRTRNCGAGVTIKAGVNPTYYGADHLIERFAFEDDGMHATPGQVADCRQTLSWDALKVGIPWGTPVNVLATPNMACGSVGGYLVDGGAHSVTFQDGACDGTFDGISAYKLDGRGSGMDNANLHIQRVTFRNHGDDAMDLSRDLWNGVVEDCYVHNAGTVISVAPFRGTLTLRNVRADSIGGSRVGSAFIGPRPGSFVKYGLDKLAGATQGWLGLENCVFRSLVPGTRGVCADGGDGPNVPKIECHGTTMRLGNGYAVDYKLHPAEWFTWDDGCTFATEHVPPNKSDLPIPMTAPAEADNRIIADLMARRL